MLGIPASGETGSLRVPLSARAAERKPELSAGKNRNLRAQKPEVHDLPRTEKVREGPEKKARELTPKTALGVCCGCGVETAVEPWPQFDDALLCSLCGAKRSMRDLRASQGAG